jgi:hypothetical protein
MLRLLNKIQTFMLNVQVTVQPAQVPRSPWSPETKRDIWWPKPLRGSLWSSPELAQNVLRDLLQMDLVLVLILEMVLPI